MTSTVRLASGDDLPFLSAHDVHVGRAELEESVGRGRVLVVEAAGDVVGWLRWNLFWDEIPFMNMLFVLPEHRGQGLSRGLIEHWESACRAAAHGFVLTSTLSNEDAQHLYRHLGYVDTGHLDLPGEPRELLLRHDLPDDRPPDR